MTSVTTLENGPLGQDKIKRSSFEISSLRKYSEYSNFLVSRVGYLRRLVLNRGVVETADITGF